MFRGSACSPIDEIVYDNQADPEYVQAIRVFGVVTYGPTMPVCTLFFPLSAPLLSALFFFSIVSVYCRAYSTQLRTVCIRIRLPSTLLRYSGLHHITTSKCR